MNSTGSAPALSLTNKSVGGGDWLYNSDSGAGQKGIENAAGTNNNGLLVRTSGKVTYKGSDCFYVDDGSALNDGSGNLGVKVQATGLSIPDKDSYVTVVGISSCHVSGVNLKRLIQATSIVPVP